MISIIVIRKFVDRTSKLDFLEKSHETKGVLSYKNPPHGRRTGQIKLNPVRFKDLRGFFPKHSIEPLIELYPNFRT